MSLVTLTLAIPVLAAALLRSPWRALAHDSAQHVFFGACVAMLMLWTMQVDFGSGLTLHLLGITTVTLMFGWPLALVAGAIVTLGSPLAGLAAWDQTAAVFLSQCAVPVAISWQIYRLSLRRLPHNFFIYIFICAFLGAGLAIGAATFAQFLLWRLDGGVSGPETAALTRFLPLYAYPEAFINGFVMTGLVVARPHWVASFDDSIYLHGK